MRNFINTITAITSAFVFIFFVSCRDDNHEDPAGFPMPSFESKFTVPPIDVNKIQYVEPLGCVNPPGHTFPTDHVYFYFNLPAQDHKYDADYILPVFAPQSGTINWMLKRSSETKVMVIVNSNFSYYLDHIILDSSLTLNSKVTAGQKIGVTGYAYAIDLGVLVNNITLQGFVNPARYGSTVNADSPYRYYTEPLKSQLYGLMNRVGTDKDGRIDYDIKGRLIGNWFHESVKIEDSNGPFAWPNEISIAPDSYDPTQLILAFGGSIGITGKFKASADDPDPAQVSVSSGRVIYHLNNYFIWGSSGTVAFQILDDMRMKAEYFPYGTVSFDFDSKAQIYTR